MIKIIIPGCPIAKARARTFTSRGRTMTYDMQHAEKGITAFLINKQVWDKDWKFDQEDTFSVEMTFHMDLPNSMPWRQKNAILWGFEAHYGKQDIDNLVKFYLDCANGILYPDDHQIIKLIAEIKYSMEPRTEMTVNINEKIKLDNDARKILELFSLDDLMSLHDSIYKIMKMHCSYESKEFKCITEDIYHIHMAKAISKLAENHTEQLNKVKKACPKYHEKAIIDENYTT